VTPELLKRWRRERRRPTRLANGDVIVLCSEDELQKEPE
jgi:hypothetical protein